MLDPLRPAILYSGACFFGQGYGTCKSSDGGAHWLPFGRNSQAGFSATLALAPRASSTEPAKLYGARHGSLYELTEVCGNAVIDSGEDCDDGNFSNEDACNNNCKTSGCGDGIVQPASEECDDGNILTGDGCSPTCQSEAARRQKTGTVSAGGTVTTDDAGQGATDSEPVQASVSSPNSGGVTVEVGPITGEAPTGFTFVNQQVTITAPAATAEEPLVFVFRIDESRIPGNETVASFQIFKNGVVVAGCASGSAALPDPCVADRAELDDGDLELTVRASSGSFWNFGGGDLPPCDPQPRSGCRRPTAPGKALLSIRDNASGEREPKDAISWSWGSGAATSTGDFGNPLGDDSYVLCAYDPSGLIFHMGAAVGGTCGKGPCWKANGNPPGSKGYKRADKAGRPDGCTGVSLKPGDAGKAKIGMKGKGINLELPALPLTSMPLTVQLQATNGNCWEASYSAAGIVKNEAGNFKAKSD